MGWRKDVRDNATATCQGFADENDTLVDRVWSARPASLVETRAIHIGGISETVRHDSGTRQRTAEVDVICTRHLSDNEEAVDAVEEMADALLEYLTGLPHAFGANTVQDPVRTASIEIAEGTMYVPGVSITCRALIMEGRS